MACQSGVDGVDGVDGVSIPKSVVQPQTLTTMPTSRGTSEPPSDPWGVPHKHHVMGKCHDTREDERQERIPYSSTQHIAQHAVKT